MTGAADAARVRDEFAQLWAQLAPIGRDQETGGYLRYAWTAPELALREWFRDQATQRGLPLTEDGNGNMFAWWCPPGIDPEQARDAVLTGSHLDSVPHGGAYDGPLGVVSSLLAVDELRRRGAVPAVPIAIGVFAEEEGSRFGLACLGTRLLSGAIEPAAAAALTDRDGATFGDAFGGLPKGDDPDLLGRFACFVELHIEQGRGLVELDRPVGVASAIWPHGRWRLEFTGEANHAGTTLMADRHDPMLTFAFTVLAANKEARLRGAHATVGRVTVNPNATNAVPAKVTAWLDARAADEQTVRELVDAIAAKATERAGRDGTTLAVTAESETAEVAFDTALRDRLSALLADPDAGPAPILPTGAGHDAGVLSAHLPTAMLFVRNPTGVSHSPAEWAPDADCAEGVRALAAVLAELAG